jgi:hypothetical protein
MPASKPILRQASVAPFKPDICAKFNSNLPYATEPVAQQLFRLIFCKRI